MLKFMKKACALLVLCVIVDSTKARDSLDTDREQDIEKENQAFVSLLMYGILSGESRGEDGTCEFTLSSEDSDVILDLFYNHEKEALDSPLDSISTIEFRFGDDYLTTSLEDIGSLSGRIGGNLVLVCLDENESNLLHQIVCLYAQDIVD